MRIASKVGLLPHVDSSDAFSIFGVCHDHSANHLHNLMCFCKPGRKNTESRAATFYCCRVIGPNLFTVFTVFYGHYAEDHLPKSNGRETIQSLSGFYDVIHT